MVTKEQIVRAKSLCGFYERAHKRAERQGHDDPEALHEFKADADCLRALIETAERLPETAQGSRVMTGDEVWINDNGTVYDVLVISVDGYGCQVFDGDGRASFRSGTFHDTREAAQHALSTEKTNG